MGRSLKSLPLFAGDEPTFPRAPAPVGPATALWLAVHCPEIALSVRRREDGRQREWLRALAMRAFEFTPIVALHPPREFLLEVAGSLELFGGLRSIEAALCRVLGDRESWTMAAAPTGLAAIWLARAGAADLTMPEMLPGGLGRLDLGVTEWPAQVQTVLREMGVRTLADCLRLPRDGFARRADPRCLLELDRALGRAREVWPRLERPADLSYESECGFEIGSTQLLWPIIVSLVDRLTADLRARQSEIRTLELVLRHLRFPQTEASIELVDPTHDKGRLLRLLGDRCERLTLSAPVVAVILNAGRLQPMTRPQARSFLEEAVQETELEDSAVELIELLRGRLSSRSVYGVRAVADHRPERAWRKIADIEEHAAPVCGPARGPRPLWILPRALRLAGGEAPLYRGRPLELLAGPERIETGWWEVALERDYYCASAHDGGRLWVFRERAACEWYLHGFFG